MGAAHFAATIRALKEAIPGVAVAVLTPDFQGRRDCIEIVLQAEPVALSTTTLKPSSGSIESAPGSKYMRSLQVLKAASEICDYIPTKSGIMPGLCGTEEDIWASCAHMA